MNSTYGDYERLEVTVQNGVALVTMSRPEKLNAMDTLMLDELQSVWNQADGDPDVRVIVLTGAGDRAFSVGGDLDGMSARLQLDPEQYFQDCMDGMQEHLKVVYSLVNSKKPVVAAINGVAIGDGLAWSLLSDITIVDEEANLIDGHTPLGLTAGDHATLIWPLLCGMAKAKYYLLTSDGISGREAERIGLVSRAVPADEVLPTALEVAEKLAATPQYAVQTTKRALNQWLRLGGVVSYDYSLALETLTLLSGDFKDSVRSFLDAQSR